MVAAAPSPDAVLDRIRELVEADPVNEDPAALNVRGYALLARLKALNRQANAATKEHKLATAAARTTVNQTHLGLQNLLYEKRHLEREIEKCRQFASIYQDIPMHSLEDFMILAPENARTEGVLADRHELMKARLAYELESQQKLEGRWNALTAERDELLKETKDQTAAADKLQTLVDQVMKSLLDTQKSIDALVPPEPVEPMPVDAGDATPTPDASLA
ncbi:unnamed protein product [Peniophora sp. CBMAI 1063]|nr:unnamed protein product [Peniophora sp. CBMAI 1063]